MKVKHSLCGRARILWQNSLKDGKPDVNLLRENIKLLTDENIRDGEFILRALIERIRIYMRENTLRVSAPVELPLQTRERILEAEGGKEEFQGGVEFVFDKSLIGGLRIEKGFDVEDYSIAGQLEILKKRLIKN